MKSTSDDVVDSKQTKKSPLSLVEPVDLIKYGLIPEFVGRIPVVAAVNKLSVEDLVRTLTEPKNSLVKQYEGLFKLNQVGHLLVQTWTTPLTLD